jgi:hypothetical protein
MPTSEGAEAERARTIDRLTAARESAEADARDARAQVVALASERAAFRQHIENQRRELHATRLELALAHRTLAETSARLADVTIRLANASAALAGVLGSRTWTLTAPVRRVLGRSR